MKDEMSDVVDVSETVRNSRKCVCYRKTHAGRSCVSNGLRWLKMIEFYAN